MPKLLSPASVSHPSNNYGLPRQRRLAHVTAALILIVAVALPVSARAQAVFVATGTLNDGRYDHAAVRLQDGRVLALGGWGVVNGGFVLALSSSEIYDPATETWTYSGSMIQGRIAPNVVVLPSGRVRTGRKRRVPGTLDCRNLRSADRHVFADRRNDEVAPRDERNVA